MTRLLTLVCLAFVLLGSTPLGVPWQRYHTMVSSPTTGVWRSPESSQASRPRLWTEEEARIERILEKAFREYFGERRIGGHAVALRVPFGLNDERLSRPRASQFFFLGAKGTPQQIWGQIDRALADAGFERYLQDITDPGKKAVVFDIQKRQYRISRDPDLLESLEKGIYPGTPTLVYVLRDDGPPEQDDVYDYLYAVSAIGVDCSGFSFHLHRRLGEQYGVDLTEELGALWRMSPSLVSRWVGLWFYNPAHGYTRPVEERIENLRPGDVILFRGEDGRFTHSAVIQSIDFQKGRIRYLQSTDWAPRMQRGVHESFIRFDPDRPNVDLSHFSVRWMQEVRPAFPGEPPLDWLTDQDRFLWYKKGLVVRLRRLEEAITSKEPGFYTNRPLDGLRRLGFRQR